MIYFFEARRLRYLLHLLLAYVFAFSVEYFASKVLVPCRYLSISFSIILIVVLGIIKRFLHLKHAHLHGLTVRNQKRDIKPHFRLGNLRLRPCRICGVTVPIKGAQI